MSSRNFQETQDPQNMLIIDNRPILRKGIALLLKEAGLAEKVYELDFPSGQQSLPESPDIIIAGVDAYDETKMAEILKSIRSVHPGCKTIFYRYEMETVIDSTLFSKGLNGYLVGNFDLEDLKLCVSRVSRGGLFILGKIMAFEINDETIKGKLDCLSPQQKIIAGYLADGMGTSKIAKIQNKKASTISTVKANIFRKMHISSVIELAQIVNREKDQKALKVS